MPSVSDDKSPLQCSLDPSWRALIGRVDDRYARSHLRPLAAFCSIHGVAPSAIGDVTLGAFGEAIAAVGIKRPKQVVRESAISWNKMAAAQPDWPSKRLTVPDNRKAVSVAAKNSPPTFVQDMDAFLDQSSGGDLFDLHQSRKLGPISRRDRTKQILQLASILIRGGRDASSIKKLSDLVEREAATAILQSLWTESGGKENGHTHNRVRLMVLIARDWPSPFRPSGQDQARRKPVPSAQDGDD